MISDSQALRAIKQILRDHADIEMKELMRLSKAVVTARHYQGEDGWDKLKEAISELEGFITPHEP